MSESVVINQECLGCWRTESFRKTDHNLEAEYYMLQSTLELWVLRAVYAQADWINTGKHLKEKQGLLVNTCKFLLCLLNVCKFISPCFHMTLDSLWPKNCWARKRIGYTELNFSFSCGIQRAERVVNVFLFVCLFVKIESICSIKGISNYACPCKVSMPIFSTISILSIPEFRYWYYLSSTLTVKED